jgi:hypothetical protein
MRVLRVKKRQDKTMTNGPLRIKKAQNGKIIKTPTKKHVLSPSSIKVSLIGF